jgi:hypothetical protein
VVIDGGMTELFVELADPAPADGTDVAISEEWNGPAIPTMTVQPGTTTGQTTVVVPVGTAPGTYLIRAAGGAGDDISTTLVVVAVDTPMLVSFTVTPDVFSSMKGVTMRMEVGLDRPAPVGGVVVRVEQIAGTSVVDVNIPTGSASAFADYHVAGAEWAPGDKTLHARFAGMKLEATLHINLG